VASVKSSSCCPGAHGRGDAVLARVGAQEPYVGADAAQAFEGLPDAGVTQVAFGVYREAVPAQRRSGRARLDPGQVDSAQGELVKELHQGAGVVVADERDQ